MSRIPKPAGGEAIHSSARREREEDASSCSRKHLRFGWWSLLVFLTVGIGLETLHGFKVGGYMNVTNETRRLMWTLAHAHGTLLALVNVAFGVTLPWLGTWTGRQRSLASACLLGASILLPAGFFLGGVAIHAGDPGLGILLVPVGALMLLVAVLLTARAAKAGSRAERKQ